MRQVQLHSSRSPWQPPYSCLWMYLHTCDIGQIFDPHQRISLANPCTSSSCRTSLNASMLSLHADLSFAANNSSLHGGFCLLPCHWPTMLCLMLLGLAGKVAGAKWEGSKTVFDEDANGVSQDSAPQQAASRQDAALTGLPQAITQDQSDHVSEGQDHLPKMKWKKMALAELQKVMTHIVAHPFLGAWSFLVCVTCFVTWASCTAGTQFARCLTSTRSVLCCAGLGCALKLHASEHARWSRAHLL